MKWEGVSSREWWGWCATGVQALSKAFMSKNICQSRGSQKKPDLWAGFRCQTLNLQPSVRVSRAQALEVGGSLLCGAKESEPYSWA